VAFETWGRLDQQRTNAILVLHALSGDSHAVGHLDRDTFRPAGGTDSLDRVHRLTPIAFSRCVPTCWEAVRGRRDPPHSMPMVPRRVEVSDHHDS